MKAVWKFAVPFEQGRLWLPDGAEILSVAADPNSEEVVIYVLVDPREVEVERRIGYFATGALIPEGAEYVGTATTRDGLGQFYAWHVFEGR